MMDPTEDIRREQQAVINSQAVFEDDKESRARLVEKYGADNVWSYDEVGKVFEIIGFMAPYCSARRLSDGVGGSLCFQHHPRYYFDFQSK